MYQKRTIRRATPVLREGMKIANEIETALRHQRRWLDKVQEAEMADIASRPRPLRDLPSIQNGRTNWLCPNCEAHTKGTGFCSACGWEETVTP
jgi:hypothetical protein